jgi:hypothetical protein
MLRLTPALLLAATVLAAPAAAMYIPPLGACAGSQCPNGETACVWAYCETATLTIQCDDVCDAAGDAIQDACAYAPNTCASTFQYVSDLASTPVGVCAGSYHCSYQGTACVEADALHCSTVYMPAHCTGTMCANGEVACAYGLQQDGTNPGGATCTSDVCKNRLCYRLCQGICDQVVIGDLSMGFGTCSGNPTSFDPNAEHCRGGIACTEFHMFSKINDPCIELMVVA